jgi:hypothetical protein
LVSFNAVLALLPLASEPISVQSRCWTGDDVVV